MLGAKVLVVEDNESVSMALRLLLAHAGFDVIGEARDGLAAVEAAEALQPDIVVLDHQLPRMSGLQAIPFIHDVAPFAQVVVLTGDLLAARELEEEPDVALVLVKPDDVPQIGERLQLFRASVAVRGRRR